jgi:hypothetical protein
MLRKTVLASVLLAAGLSLLAGCNGMATSSKSAATDSAKKDSATAEKKLSEEDRKLAAKQKVCPISGQPLGSMGDPYKMIVKGRAIFLCCPSCVADVDKDPDSTLKKVDELLAKKAK